MDNNDIDIRAIRLARHETQPEFARTMNVDTSTISRWERNTQRPTNNAYHKLSRLARDIKRKGINHENTNTRKVTGYRMTEPASLPATDLSRKEVTCQKVRGSHILGQPTKAQHPKVVGLLQ
jgi:transcriptional regulator with XRE-family HTH domain